MKLIRYEYPQACGKIAYDSFLGSAAPAFGRFGSLFEDLFGNSPEFTQTAMDLYEDDQNYYVRLELPGVKKDEIELELENSVLAIRSANPEKEQETEPKTRFQRSISVPDGVALDKIGANLGNGILTVSMPKEEARKPRQIEIS